MAWTSTAATFYDAVNEKPPASANDADYIQSSVDAVAEVVTLTLEAIPTPGVGTVSIFVRCQTA